jgi:polyphenol oxidase
MYTSSLLSPLNHGFFTRRGGVSAAPYDSLSFVVNKGDSMDNVRQNRALAMEKLGLADRELVTVNQVHGTNVIVVDEPWGFGQGKTPDADAIITRNPNVVLGVFTADCVPVLLYDEPTQTIAAVHSGWRGALQNVVGVTLDRMIDMGVDPSTVKAAIGPCIAQDNYEVGAEVHDEFTSASSDNERFFKSSVTSGKYMLNLPGVVWAQLVAAKLGGVDNLDLNTYQREEDFFSCRRSFHRGESVFGCMLSAIALR